VLALPEASFQRLCDSCILRLLFMIFLFVDVLAVQNYELLLSCLVYFKFFFFHFLACFSCHANAERVLLPGQLRQCLRVDDVPFVGLALQLAVVRVERRACWRCSAQFFSFFSVALSLNLCRQLWRSVALTRAGSDWTTRVHCRRH